MGQQFNLTGAAVDRDELSPQQRDFYQTNGYLHVAGLLGRDEAASYRKELHELAERLGDRDATWSSMRSADETRRTRLMHCHDVQFHSAAFTRLLVDPRLTRIAQGIIGPNVQLHHTKMFIKPPENGSPFPMHQDYPYFPHEKHSMIAVIIHFDDAPVEKGCLRVVPGSHRLGPLEAVGQDHHLPEDRFPLEAALPLPARAGDAIFMSYLLAHGSGLNRSNEARTTVLIQMRDPTDTPLVDKHASRGQGMMLAGIDPRKPDSEFARSSLLAAALAFCVSPISTDAAGAAPHAAPAACKALAGLRLADVTIVLAEATGAGRFTAPDGESHDVPAFCRVHGTASPTADSRIGFELWMPASGWNRRYYQLGNGGFAGNIHYPSLAAYLREGNAVAVTDTGHRGTGFDAGWARGHPQKIVDYGYRSLAETSSAARAIIQAYYGELPRHRYFAGCSNGGRQALMLAQRFPDDWDGILAGAPANGWTRQLAGFAWIQQALRSDPRSWIAPAKLPAIQRAAITSCTAAARVVNGIPSDPRFCRFDPSQLLCKGREESDECLTPPQAAMLARIQEGLRDPRARARVFFGFEATAAAVPGNWERWIVNPDRSADSQLTLGEQFFRNMVFGDPDWKLDDFDASRDLAFAQSREVGGEPLGRVLDATGTDLAPFMQHGAKLLMYFGWADALISPQAGVDYYERVIERMGGLEQTQAFYRLFMVPGMMHCQGGPAPNAFGQAPVAPALRDDAEHDIRRALEAWVEKGIAPKRIIAAKYVNDDPARGVATTRALCPFPQVCP